MKTLKKLIIVSCIVLTAINVASAQNAYFFKAENGLLGVKEVSGKALIVPK